MTRIVILGSGFAALTAIRQLREQRVDADDAEAVLRLRVQHLVRRRKGGIQHERIPLGEPVGGESEPAVAGAIEIREITTPLGIKAIEELQGSPLTWQLLGELKDKGEALLLPPHAVRPAPPSMAAAETAVVFLKKFRRDVFGIMGVSLCG